MIVIFIFLYFGINTNLIWFICYKWWVCFPVEIILGYATWFQGLWYEGYFTGWVPNNVLPIEYGDHVYFNFMFFKYYLDSWFLANPAYFIRTKILVELDVSVFSWDLLQL
jgi:hypothetical protein